MKARSGLVKVTLILPALLGLGFAATPAYAISDCTPGMYSEGITQCPNENTAEQPSQAPVAPTAPTTQPPAPQPSPTALPTTPVSISPTAPAEPLPVPTVTVTVAPPETPAPIGGNGGGVVENQPVEPGYSEFVPADQVPGSDVQPPAVVGGSVSGSSGNTPSKPLPTESSPAATEVVEQASTDTGTPNEKKVWPLIGAALTMALIVAIWVYSVKRFGYPWEKQS